MRIIELSKNTSYYKAIEGFASDSNDFRKVNIDWRFWVREKSVLTCLMAFKLSNKET